MTKSLSILGLAVALAGCATTPPPPPSPIPIVAIPSNLFLFRELRAEPSLQGVNVTGKTARKKKRFRYSGHLHVEAISRGQVVAWTDAQWRKPSYRLTFSTTGFRATLPLNAAQIDQVRVTYMPKGHDAVRKPRNPS